MTAPLPADRSLEEVAIALGESSRYVQDKCRQRLWPHSRGARGRITFTDEQVAAIRALREVSPQSAEDRRWALAPRSRRSA